MISVQTSIVMSIDRLRWMTSRERDVFDKLGRKQGSQPSSYEAGESVLNTFSPHAVYNDSFINRAQSLYLPS